MGQDDKTRHLIIGTGRSGSSLLAAIMADAGAVFGLPSVDGWDPRSGAYEHPLIHQARRWQSRAQKIDESLIPNALGRSFCEGKMNAALDTLLNRVHYVKSTTLVRLVQPIAQAGYAPCIIVSYRAFDGYARSRYRRFGWSMDTLLATYTDVYSTAALQLQVFGGCVVDFDAMVDREQTAWAEALAHLTGLAADDLLSARDDRLTARGDAPVPFELPVPRDTLDQLHATFKSLQGQTIEPV